MSDDKYKDIPASACTLAACAFEVGDNGDGSKSAPVRLVARSGQPIDHPYWGKVAHDLSGMHMHKSRLALDYVHDSKEVIGYLNHFDIESGDLVTSGALVPFKDSDRATEILYKMGEGVPYEASINFGGDGIEVQDVDAGEFTEVNGYQFEGPGVVIRSWPLRGVAVCPYGADMNTESASAFSNSKQVFSASVVDEPETEKENEMEAEKKDVELVEAVEGVAVEVEAELADAVEAVPEVEAEVEAEVEEVVEEVSAEADPRAELSALTEEFGAEIAVKIFSAGGAREDALVLALTNSKAEVEALRAKVSSKKPDVAPVEFASTDGEPKKSFGDVLFKKNK